MYSKTLYQKDTTGNIRVWSIQVIEQEESDYRYNIIVESGVLCGNLVTAVTPINKGNSNRTILEQAIFDSESEVKKKIKSGYVSRIEDIKEKFETATINKPAKGEVYHPQGNRGKTLAKAGLHNKTIGIQRKIDGWRYRIKVEYLYGKFNFTFHSSSGDVVLGFPQIEKSILSVLQDHTPEIRETIILDGEMYRHGLQIVKDHRDNIISFHFEDNKSGFQATASACGTNVHVTPIKQKLRDLMQFHIFDIVIPNVSYRERMHQAHLFADGVNIIAVENNECVASDKRIQDAFNKFLSEGYEGVIIRDMSSEYKHRKCNQFLKYKPIIDDEFEIIGFNESIEGNTLGSLKLSMVNGVVFDANLKDELGTDAMRKKIWDWQDMYVGKIVTVEFMEYTNDGIPRIPRAKCFRKQRGAE